MTAVATTIIEKIKQHKLIAILLVIGPIFAAVVAIHNFGKIYDSLGLPRPVFTNEYEDERNAARNELTTLRTKMREFEIEYRNRNIRYDQRALREVEKEILRLTEQGITIPDSLQEFKDVLNESILQGRERLRVLEGQQ